ncbi:MAG: hypothetical protein ACHQ49_18150 [Elusimicrobiota bacterium]
MTARPRTQTRAFLFLAAATYLAYGGPRIASLGFYRDDWRGLWLMTSAGSRLGAVRALAAQPGIMRRPLDVLLSSIPFMIFGARPLGWFVVIAALNGLGAFAVYRILRKYRTGETRALLGAAVYLAYPSKDTALFWSGFINGPFAILAFLWGYLLHLDFVETPRPWKAAAACLCFVACFASYDSCLFLLPILLITPDGSSGPERRRLIRSTLLLSATTAAVVALRWILMQKILMPTGLAISLSHAAYVYLAGLNANFGPDQLASTIQGAARAFARAPLVAAAALLAPALVLFGGARENRGDSGEDRAALRRLVALGAAIYVLGYAPIAISLYLPAPTAEENRLNIVPAVGIALALGGWVALRRRTRLSEALAAFFAGGLLAASVGFSASWAEASRRRLDVRDLVVRRLPEWPRGDALFLRLPELHVDGRAAVFDNESTLTAAVRLWTGDAERRALVISPGVQFLPEGARLDGGAPFAYNQLAILDGNTGALKVHPLYEDCRGLVIPPNVHNRFAALIRAFLARVRPAEQIL